MCGDENTFICRLDPHSQQLYTYHQEQNHDNTTTTASSSTTTTMITTKKEEELPHQASSPTESAYLSNNPNCYCSPNYILIGSDTDQQNNSHHLNSYALRLDYTLQSFMSNYSSSFQSNPIIPEYGNELISISTVEVLCGYESIVQSGILINQIDKYMSFTPMDQDGNFLELSHTGSFLIPTPQQKQRHQEE